MLLNSQYPIIALAMNQVSDIKFAVACAEAGVTPSLGVFNYHNLTEPYFDYNKLVDDLIYFKQARGNSDVIFSMYQFDLKNTILRKILTAAGIKIIEIIPAHIGPDFDVVNFINDVKTLKDEGFILFLRSIAYDKKLDHPGRNGTFLPYFDILLFKGNKGAGTVTNQSLEEMFFVAKNDFPDKKFVAAGGIQNKQQIDFFINSGALAVGIGTLFAASVESVLSTQTKELMVQANFEKVKHTTYADKNALVFKPVDTGNKNYTPSLRLGMRRPDIGGHIYCGEGVNAIDSILPLKEIVNRLVM